MKATIGAVMSAFLMVAMVIAIVPVYADVGFVNISPSVLTVGKAITFYGGATGTSADNQIEVEVFVGPDCSNDGLFASTYTVANSTNAYSVTLSFPVDIEYSGWQLQSQYQQYQSGLPAGSYSVGVADMASMQSGSGGVCRNFTVGAQPVPEFSWLTFTLFLTLTASLCVLQLRRKAVA